MTDRKVTKAVFPAAGLATRFLPATKAVPKELLPLVDKPVLQYAVEEAIEAGIDEFVFITSRRKPAIEAHFKPNPYLEGRVFNDCNIPPDKLHIVYQDEPLGLGHAVYCAKQAVGDEPFAVLLPDDLILGSPGALRQMVNFYQSNPVSAVIAAVDVPDSETHLYGMIDGQEKIDGIHVTKLVEKPAPGQSPSNVAIMGRYILPPEIFGLIEADINNKQRKGEVQLTSAIASLAAANDVRGLRIKGGRYDCGHCAGWIDASIAYALQRPELAPTIQKLIKKWSTQ